MFSCDTVHSFSFSIERKRERERENGETISIRRCGGTNLGGWMCVTLVRMPLVKEAIKDGYK